MIARFRNMLTRSRQTWRTSSLATRSAEQISKYEVPLMLASIAQCPNGAALWWRGCVALTWGPSLCSSTSRVSFQPLWPTWDQMRCASWRMRSWPSYTTCTVYWGGATDTDSAGAAVMCTVPGADTAGVNTTGANTLGATTGRSYKGKQPGMADLSRAGLDVSTTRNHN